MRDSRNTYPSNYKFLNMSIFYSKSFPKASGWAERITSPAHPLWKCNQPAQHLLSITLNGEYSGW